MRPDIRRCSIRRPCNIRENAPRSVCASTAATLIPGGQLWATRGTAGEGTGLRPDREHRTAALERTSNLLSRGATAHGSGTHGHSALRHLYRVISRALQPTATCDASDSSGRRRAIASYTWAFGMEGRVGVVAATQRAAAVPIGLTGNDNAATAVRPARRAIVTYARRQVHITAPGVCNHGGSMSRDADGAVASYGGPSVTAANAVRGGPIVPQQGTYTIVLRR